MTDWIKVDAEHMPPDMETVFVLGQTDNGKEYFSDECRWNQEENAWESLYEHNYDYWKKIIGVKITHWMPYPDPAQD